MTSEDPLLGPKLKIERSKKLILELETKEKDFFESSPFVISMEIDNKTQENIYRVNFKENIPNIFSIIIGDIAHNIRSALDQLVCALVLTNHKQITKGNSFPIAGSKKLFEKIAISRLRNISTKSDRFIRRLKPYKDGYRQIWLLSELNNMDKHNAIVPILVGQVQTMAQWGMPGFFHSPDGSICIGGGPDGSVPWGFHKPPMAPINTQNIGVMTDGCELYRSFSTRFGIPENIEFRANICLGDLDFSNNEPIVDVLKNISNFSERIIIISEEYLMG